MWNGKVDHVFHVWINSEGNASGKPKDWEMPIDPHGRNLYAFKAAMQTLPWLAKSIGKERRHELPMVHQQCSHSAPEALPENYLMCALGKKLAECPILKRLRTTFDEMRTRKNNNGTDSYYASITDEEVDQVAAAVCVWHMLMGQDGFVDWNEGAVQDASDRRFWSNLYDSLAQGINEGR